MDTRALIEAVKTRASCNDGNPPKHSLLYELTKALERLEQYEKAGTPQEIDTILCSLDDDADD